MATTFIEAREDVVGFVSAVFLDRFPAVYDCTPRIRLSILMALSDDPLKPALKLHGWPCAAMIKVVSGEERARGGPDAVILIDATRWQDMNVRRREAVVAHELYHIEVKPEAGNDPGKVQVDEYGRPKIKLRAHDWELGGFREIVEWYGDDAVEKRIINTITEDLAQMTLPFPDTKTRKAASS